MTRRRRAGRSWAVDDEILEWFYVRYKSLYLTLALLLAAAAGAAYYYLDRFGAPDLRAAQLGPGSMTTAHFAWLEGSVKVRRAGSLEWETADRGMQLRRFDLVRTAPHSVAEVVFFDRTVIRVSPDSLVTIEDTSEDRKTRARRVAWHVSSGEVNFETARRNMPDSVTAVSTPTTRGTVGELARATVRVEDTGATDLRLYRGSGTLQTRAGQTIDLATAQVVRVDPEGVAADKAALPTAPVLLDPPHQAAVVPEKEKVVLSWTPVPGAKSYRVMMDVSAYFPWPLLDRRGLTEHTVEIRGLQKGKYYWRVAAETTETEGAFSDYARLTVAKPSDISKLLPPPIEIESVDLRTNILQIKGTTTAGASLSVNGYRLLVRPDGSFNDFVTLDKSGRQNVVVRAAGLEGGVSMKQLAVAVVD